MESLLPRRGDAELSRTDDMKFALSVLILTASLIGCVAPEYPMPNENEQGPWVVRTDFSDSQAWLTVAKQLSAPQRDPITGMQFNANVTLVDDLKYSGVACNDLVHALPSGYPGFLVFIVDDATLQTEEHPILIVEFSPQSTNLKDYERSPNQTPVEQIRTFRAIPSTIQSIENNLSIANMDFEDFANAVDSDGVFRGFSQ